MTIADRQIALFDYAGLDTETREFVQTRTADIKGLMRRAAGDIVTIGLHLIAVKARLGHGYYGVWLTSEFDWSEPTALRFMRVAERFKSVNLTDLEVAPSALYLLAAPSTPEAAREEAIGRAEDGEAITYSDAQEIVERHKEEAAPEPQAPQPELESEQPELPDVPDVPDQSAEDGGVPAVPDDVLFDEPDGEEIAAGIEDDPELDPAIVIDPALELGIADEPADLGDTDAEAAKVESDGSGVESSSVGDPHAVHYSSKSAEWYTPDAIVERVMEALGDIDLDPCADPDHGIPAMAHMTAADDGLARDWFGRVYMNPPYGQEIKYWARKLRDEFDSGRVDAAIALVPARTDTDWWELLNTFPVCFAHGRLRFSGHKTGAPFPSALIYLGADYAAFRKAFNDVGRVYRPDGD